MVRPLTVLGATLQIAKYDGSTVPLRSAMTSHSIKGVRRKFAVAHALSYYLENQYREANSSNFPYVVEVSC